MVQVVVVIWASYKSAIFSWWRIDKILSDTVIYTIDLHYSVLSLTYSIGNIIINFHWFQFKLHNISPQLNDYNITLNHLLRYFLKGSNFLPYFPKEFHPGVTAFIVVSMINYFMQRRWSSVGFALQRSLFCTNPLKYMNSTITSDMHRVNPIKICKRFIVFCFISVIVNFWFGTWHVFTHIPYGWFNGTGTTILLPQCP